MKKMLCLVLVLCLLLSGCVWSSEEAKLEKIVDELLASEIYENWLWVANCEESTAEMLADCAKKCAKIKVYDSEEALDYAVEIATSLCNHPNANVKVAKELMKSTSYAVWNIVAAAECNSEGTLKTLAAKCARISAETCVNSKDDNVIAESACEIAKTLLSNPHATDEVAEKLMDSQYYSVWVVVASAECNTEETLVKLAKKCAAINDENSRLSDYDIANGKGADDWALTIVEPLVNNPESTENVFVKLLGSCYPEVREVAFMVLGYTVPDESAPNLEEP